MNSHIILASSSPRRKYLLSMLLGNFGLNFDTIPANISEYIPNKVTNYPGFVKSYAVNKALRVSQSCDGVIIGADTIVVLNKEILGKPRDRAEAKKMLRSLSGMWHKVYTGIAIFNSRNSELYDDYEVTKVKFRNLTKDEVDFYIKTGSPFDKAGGYGIQDDFGSTFIERIEGDYFNVVGLPVVKTYLGLRKLVRNLKLVVS